MNTKLIIEAASAALGIAAGAATAYFSKDPQAGAAIGGAVYLGSKGLGYIDPGASIPQVTVTPQDLQDAVKAATDVQARNWNALMEDLLPLIGDVRAAKAAAEPRPTPPLMQPVQTVATMPIAGSPAETAATPPAVINGG